jgi:uncharacterized protein (TIGR03435 family)
MRYAVFGALMATGLVVVAGQGAPTKDGPRFEVASVKPNPETFGGWSRPMPDRFTATGNTVVQLITLAYQLPNYRVVGGAEWTKRERFDVNATIAGPRTQGDLWFMLRHLLEDRFALRVHREERPTEVYALMMARNDRRLGPNLTRLDRTCAQQTGDWCASSEGIGRYRSTGLRWEDGRFVNFVERVAGRPVLDRSGLSGQFDIALEWNQEVRRIPEGSPSAVSLAELEARPALSTALREQLGLKLEPLTEPIEVLVIDSVERPTRD